MGHTVSELEEQQAKRIAEVEERNRLLEAEVRLLKQKLDALIRIHFGSKSEKLDPGQLELLLGEDAAKKPDASAGKILAPVDVDREDKSSKFAPNKERKPRIPEHLPLEEEELIPDCVKACPDAWKRISAEVISEQLDYRPACFVRKRLIRPKYVRRSQRHDLAQAPITAPLPPRVVEGGLPTAGLLAQVLTAKYCDHLPLYRQEQIYRSRHGVDLPRQTLCRWVEQSAHLLEPVARAIHAEVFSSSHVQVDETVLKYISPGTKKTQHGYLWAARVPGDQGATYYHWGPSRSHRVLLELVPESYRGTLQSDGYGAYQTFIGKRPEVDLAACWAHARRKFKEAFDAGESLERSGWILRQISHLYRIETKLRLARAGPALREANRRSESRMIATRLQRALVRLQSRHLPQSYLGKAISYALGQWKGLMLPFENGHLEIDNNQVENAIRPTKLGMKNWLFIGREEAGWQAAVIYTILANCKQQGLEPWAYLKEVLETLPAIRSHEVPVWTPRALACQRRLLQTKQAS